MWSLLVAAARLNLKIVTFSFSFSLTALVALPAVRREELAGDDLSAEATKRVNLCTAVNDALHTAMGADFRRVNPPTGACRLAA